MMKSCEDCTLVRPLLGAYVDGELGAETAQRLCDHVAACIGCRGALERLAEVERLLDRMEPEPPSAEVWEAMERRLMARARGRAAGRTLRAAALAAAAAAVLAAVAFFVVELYPRQAPVIPPGGYTAQSEDDAPLHEQPLGISVRRG